MGDEPLQDREYYRSKARVAAAIKKTETEDGHQVRMQSVAALRSASMHPKLGTGSSFNESRVGTFSANMKQGFANETEHVLGKDVVQDNVHERSLVGMAVFSGQAIQDPYVVLNMPLAIQKGFRKKLLGILTLQLLFVIAILCTFEYVTPIHDTLVEPLHSGTFNYTRFDNFQNPLKGSSAGGVSLLLVGSLVALMVLYIVKYRHPTNFLMLGVYTVIQSYAFAGVDSYFSSIIIIQGYLYMLVVIAVMYILSTREVIKKAEEEGGEDKLVLMTYKRSGLVGFCVMLVLATVIHILAPMSSTSATILGLLFAAFFVWWIAFDADCMQYKLSADEYLSAVIFFYTDLMLLLLLFCLIVTFFLMSPRLTLTRMNCYMCCPHGNRGAMSDDFDSDEDSNAPIPLVVRRTN